MSNRLGNLHHGAEDIINHAFFHGYDWDALVNYTLVPPWIPKLKGHNDASFFLASSLAAGKLDLDLQADMDPEAHDKYTHVWDTFGAMETGALKSWVVAPECAPVPEPHSVPAPELHRAIAGESAAPLIW